MADLIAQGPQPNQRWRRSLPDPTTRESVSLGRSSAQWTTPWDSQISRTHVRVTPLSEDRISIERSAVARNPIFYQGREIDRATLVPGEHFVIGATTFTLTRRPTASRPDRERPESGTPRKGNGTAGEQLVSQLPIDEQTFDVAAVRRETFYDAASRMDILTRLPDLIAGSHTQDELLVRLTGVLMQAIPDSITVAFVRPVSEDDHVDKDPGDFEHGTVDGIEILYGDQRPVADQLDAPEEVEEFPVSRRLVARAVSTSMAVLHRWNRTGVSGMNPQTQFTAAEQRDWAMAIPIRPETACPGWVVYVSGSESAFDGYDPSHSEPAGSGSPAMEMPFGGRNRSTVRRRQDDVKFVELIAGTVGNLLLSRRLQKRQIAMRQFFSPVVLSAIADEDSDRVLKPSRAELSVLFCDLRGFSEASLRHKDDLLGLLSQVSRALSVMTGHILDADGVIGDFHGDAAMGFWGWPIAQDQSAMAALRAAIAIRESFRREKTGFQCGIGIASGAGVAGGIGSDDQIKVTAFGPVVNLASRLESLTKSLNAEILLDQVSYRQISKAIDPSSSGNPVIGGEIRDLGPVSIKGWASPEPVFQWIPSPLESSPSHLTS